MDLIRSHNPKAEAYLESGAQHSRNLARANRLIHAAIGLSVLDPVSQNAITLSDEMPVQDATIESRLATNKGFQQDKQWSSPGERTSEV
uniref:Uncharacterized protein n=1 Tax=Oryza barthii TaxID=65489 RepID=A0A0D3G102_9ORYZ